MIMSQIVTNGIASVNDNPAAAAGLNGTVFNGLDVAVILCFIVGMIATVWYSMRKKNESGRGLLPFWTRRQLAADRFLYLFVEHRFRAPGRFGGRGVCHRNGDGALGDAGLDDFDFGLGFCAPL